MYERYRGFDSTNLAGFSTLRTATLSSGFPQLWKSIGKNLVMEIIMSWKLKIFGGKVTQNNLHDDLLCLPSWHHGKQSKLSWNFII